MVSAYKNAKDVLPDDLLEAVQRYLQGELLYVPVKGPRRPWGERTGARGELARRNQAIRDLYAEGRSLEELASMFHLSVATIESIVRGRPRKPRRQ